MKALGIDYGQELVDSHVAAKVNGFLAGFTDEKDLYLEAPHLGLTAQMMDYIAEKAFVGLYDDRLTS